MPSCATSWRRATSRGPAAASAIGDDRIQERSRGYAVPDSFTHGTAAQRVLVQARPESGDLKQCNTFERGSCDDGSGRAVGTSSRTISQKTRRAGV
jgi:hypothetical protein